MFAPDFEGSQLCGPCLKGRNRGTFYCMGRAGGAYGQRSVGRPIRIAIEEVPFSSARAALSFAMVFRRARHRRLRDGPTPPAGLDLPIPDGWQPQAWAVELERKADCCEELHPALAADYRRQAVAIRAGLPGNQ
jgi:hypothetical protein